MMEKLKKVWNAASTVLVVFVLICAVLLVGARLMGVQVFTIVSGSMEPELPVGSLIFVKDIDRSEVKVGDIITYVLPSGTPSTHRVIEINGDNEYFYTKGDAVAKPDKNPVHHKNLIGTPIYDIPYLGYVAHFIQEPPGTYIAIVAAALLLFSAFLPDSSKKKETIAAPAPQTDEANDLASQKLPADKA